MKRLWRFILNCLEALADDDRNVAQRQRDHEDNQNRSSPISGAAKADCPKIQKPNGPAIKLRRFIQKAFYEEGTVNSRCVSVPQSGQR